MGFFLGAFVDTFDLEITSLNVENLELVVLYIKTYSFIFCIKKDTEPGKFLVKLTINPNNMGSRYKKVLGFTELQELLSPFLSGLFLRLDVNNLVFLDNFLGLKY